MEVKFEHIYYQNDKFELNNLNISFHSDKVYGLIGPSGSGKSCLGKIITGKLLCINDDFRILYSEQKKDYKEMFDKRIDYVEEQIDCKDERITVYDILRQKITQEHYRENELKKRILDALKMVNLSREFMNRTLYTLSTGQLRKIAIAKALICNPKLIVFDEPTIGLDPYEQKNLVKLIRMLKNRYHKIVIVISNDLDFLLPVVDHFIVLYNGKIVMNDSKYQVLKETNKLKRLRIQVPKMIEFSDIVLQKKKIKIGYRDLMNDLIKDIYRYAEWGCKKEKK